MAQHGQASLIIDVVEPLKDIGLDALAVERRVGGQTDKSRQAVGVRTTKGR